MGNVPGGSTALITNKACAGAHTVALVGLEVTVGNVALAATENSMELTNSKPDK